MSEPFKLIVISSEVEVENEVQNVCQLFNCGLEYFHLRKYRRDEAEMGAFISSIPAEFHNRIITHSNYDITERFDLRGIHLNEENRSKLKDFDNKKIVSTSFHSLEEIEENTHQYKYVFLSPVFDSISKPDYRSRFDLKSIETRFQFWEVQKIKAPEVIALGGIDANNITAVKQAGFAGAAILGAIWNSKDPVRAFQEIRSKVD